MELSEDCFLTPEPFENSTPSEKPFPEKLSLDENSIQGILNSLADNAWYGRKPISVSFCAGEHIIQMDGYTYDPSYESSLDGQTLYGKDSRNVDAYRNEVYQSGMFHSLADAVQHIKEQTQGLDFVLQKEKKPSLDKILKDSEPRQTVSPKSSEQQNKEPAPER